MFMTIEGVKDLTGSQLKKLDPSDVTLHLPLGEVFLRVDPASKNREGTGYQGD